MQQPKDKMTAGLLAIFLGWAGVHQFYLGNNTRGLIYIGISIVTCTVGGAILGIIDGIMYLTKDDATFQRCYLNWFCGEPKEAVPPGSTPPPSEPPIAPPTTPPAQ